MSKFKLNDELIDELSTYIENGMTNKDACSLCNISEVILYRWLKYADEAEANPQDKELQRKYKRYIKLKEAILKAQVAFKAFHVQSIMNASKKGNWTASAWLLERKFPAEYGSIDRQTVMAILAKEEHKPEHDNLVDALRLSCADVISMDLAGDEPEDV